MRLQWRCRSPHIYNSLQYDSIKDFIPICCIGYFPFILAVDVNAPAKTPQEFVARAKRNKGMVFYA